jgi:hypothetical protein
MTAVQKEPADDTSDAFNGQSFIIQSLCIDSRILNLATLNNNIVLMSSSSFAALNAAWLSFITPSYKI